MAQTTHDKYSRSVRDRMARAYSWVPGRGTSSDPSAGQAPAQSIPPTEMFDLAGIRHAVAEMQRNCASVGQTPPGPPTVRARIGALIIRVMQRALFWYTPQIVDFHNAAVRAQEQQVRGLEAVALAIHDIQTQWQEQTQALAGRVNQLEETVSADAQRNRELLQELDRIAAEHATEIERLRTGSGNPEQLAKLERRMGGFEDGLGHLAILGRDVADLKIRIYGDMMARVRDEEAAARRRSDWSRRFDEFYVQLQEVFRGPWQIIKERLQVYLPMVERAVAGKEKAAILDIGCGRGEWLELLRDHGRDPLGIDQNRMMVRLCETKGLRAREADAIDFLKSLPGGSLDVITAFHVIEHLPMQALFELFAETHRVLTPTGVAIFETPNPRNLATSAQYFYMDPTHRHPIPPELGQFLAQTHGFEQVDMVALNAWPETYHVKPGDNADLAGRFNELFYGPQDYGIVAWKTRRESGDAKALV